MLQELRTHGDAEESAQVAVFDTAPAAPERTLLDILDTTADRFPHAPAIDDGTRILDYQDTMTEVARLAQRLRAARIGAGDRVGIRVPSGSAELYLAILAVLSAGAAYVPVDADDPADRAELVWAEAGVCAVFEADARLRLRAEVPPGDVDRRPVPDDDAWIIFTSGSTGKPKGVAVSQRSAAAFVDAEARLFLRERPLGPGDRVLAGLSVAFDASCEEMWLAWRHGACLVPAPRAVVRAGLELGPWLVEREVTAVSTVPTLAALWPVEALAKVRLVILGGEACPRELAERLAGAGREVWNTYGPTEATVVACAAELSGADTVRIGLPLDGWQLAVLNQHDEPVLWGEVGELVIGGVGLGRYLDQAKDAEKYVELPALGWSRGYRSGDLVRADREGLVFLGRADDQVKLGGRRIELGEIDAALNSLPGVSGAAAAVRKTAAGGQVLVGYLVPQGDPATFDHSAARGVLGRRLPAALVPLLAVVDALPTRTSGKVDRNALPWPLPANSTGESTVELQGLEGWLAKHWTDLLGVPVSASADFFELGGGSLAAAQLVSTLRRRYPGVSVADVYQHPTLTAMAARLEALGTDGVVARSVRPTSRWSSAVQFALLAVLLTVVGWRWVLGLAAINNLLGADAWVDPVPWWTIILGWVVLFSAPGRLATGVAAARLLLRGVKPGSYRRGGSVHLRLWATERLVALSGMAVLAGTPWAGRYARALGCKVGRGVTLHTLPPVTGMATFGDGCAVESEADLAGWWLDGDLLHLGEVHIGPGARVGTRCTLLPGAVVEQDAELAPGSALDGRVAAGEHWAGTPARRIGRTGGGWPAPRTVRSRRWHLAYPAAMLGFGLLPMLAALPSLVWVAYLVSDAETMAEALGRAALAAPVATVVSALLYATLIAIVVRLAGRSLRPGLHPADGRVAWCAWLTMRLMATARASLFPMYASLATPVWLRRLGATVGRRVESSTVIGLPGLMRVDDGSFLADDTVVAPYEVRGGWLRLGHVEVGKRAFVGNSGMVAPGRKVPDGALIGVLSAAPESAPPGSSWLGQPPMELPRVAKAGAEARTFAPPLRLVLARAAVEAGRVIPLVLSVVLAQLVFFTLDLMDTELGLVPTALLSGLVLLVFGLLAGLVTTIAKWVLVGRFRAGEHPLWSSFVWRNELFDTFIETLAVPWLVGAATGTPLLNVWLRSLGAKIGRGVWCDTHWLPETDLVRLGDGVSVNRGCVVQTHLFHDRIMRLDRVELGSGSTLGPHSIALPGSTVEAGTTVGPTSLVMAGETVPGSTRWLGNPICAWPATAHLVPV